MLNREQSPWGWRGHLGLRLSAPRGTGWPGSCWLSPLLGWCSCAPAPLNRPWSCHWDSRAARHTLAADKPPLHLLLQQLYISVLSLTLHCKSPHFLCPNIFHKKPGAVDACTQAVHYPVPTRGGTVPFFSPVNGTKSSLSLCSSACFSR